MVDSYHTDIPTQNVVFEPYSQKFYSYYDHNDSIVKYYISPEFGDFTKLVGENTIIEGLGSSDHTYTSTSVSCTIGLGRFIIDNTYVEVESVETLTYDNANVLDDSGFFVSSIRFNNANTTRSNKVKYHLTYFTSANTSFQDFDNDKNLIITGIYNFTKTGANITSFTEDTFQTSLTLDGVSVPIRNNETYTMTSLIDGGIIGYDPTDTSDAYGGDNIQDLITYLIDSGEVSAMTIA